MQTVLLPIAWLLVLAPLSWGVARSVQRSMPLFTEGTPAGTRAPATLTQVRTEGTPGPGAIPGVARPDPNRP